MRRMFTRLGRARYTYLILPLLRSFFKGKVKNKGSEEEAPSKLAQRGMIFFHMLSKQSYISGGSLAEMVGCGKTGIPTVIEMFFPRIPARIGEVMRALTIHQPRICYLIFPTGLQQVSPLVSRQLPLYHVEWVTPRWPYQSGLG